MTRTLLQIEAKIQFGVLREVSLSSLSITTIPSACLYCDQLQAWAGSEEPAFMGMASHTRETAQFLRNAT
ncbi:MAG: hypothetical protein RQ801_15990 [Spirochaetaceae bacterium]|nr:hypothetical protein [Spirochaetaceae bacterium]MDT8299811.1 hypothetical protein [Spirochaetaceae bacterium]